MRRWVVGATVILLSLSPPPAGSQPASEPPVVLLTDATGDAAFPMDAGESHPASVLDIEALSMERETEESFVFGLKLAHADVPTGVGSTTILYQAQYRIQFALRGTDATYELAITALVGEEYARPKPVFFATWGSWAELCGSLAGDRCRETWGMYQGALLDVPHRTFTIEVPKYAFSELRNDTGAPAFVSLRAGAEFADFVVTSETYDSSSPFNPDFHEIGQDRAPESGAAGSYRVKHSGPSSRLRVALGDPTGSWGSSYALPLLPDRNQTVRFSLINDAPEKRIVQLQFGIQEEDRAAGFEFWAPKAVLIGAHQWRNYTFAVRAPPYDPPRPWPNMTVRASVPGTDEYRTTIAQLVPGHELTPTQNRYYFHAKMFPGSDEPDPFGTAFGLAYGRIYGCDYPCPNTVVTPREDEPGMDPATRGTLYWTSDPDRGDFYRIWDDYAPPPRLAQPVALDPKGLVRFEVTLGSERRALEDAEVQFEAKFVNAGDIATFRTNTVRKTLPVEGTTLTLEGKLRGSFGGLVPAGSYLEVGYRIFAEETMPFGFDSLVQPTTVWVKPRVSRISLPVVELPQHARVATNPSPFQISFSEAREDFVNPGESRLFNLTVTNFDVLEQRLELAANASQPGWEASLLPGTRFALDPSDSVKVGLLVRAPPTAGEGEKCLVTVSAQADDGSVRRETALVTAVSFDLADDVGAFEADRADATKQVKEPGGTPSVSALVALLVLTGWALRRR